MEHTVTGMRVRSCLLLATIAGCGTSDAVITAIPIGGVGPATGTGSSSGAGQLGTPIMSGLTAGIGGSSVVRATTTTAATGGIPVAIPTATAGMSSPMQANAAGGIPPIGQSGSGAVNSHPAAIGCRVSKFSLAVRLTADLSWAETVGLMGGAGKAYLWSKLTIEPSTSTVSEFRMCGGLMPAYQTTAVGGNTMVFQRTPQTAFDQPTMPAVSGGSAVRVDSTLTLEPGTLVLGLTLPDPAGPWPASSIDRNVMPVDVEGDGKPGLTSLVRNDAKFTGSPTSILQTERLDASYVAARLAYQATLNDAACVDTLKGVAKLLAYDTMMLGCHVKDRSDCRPEELQFLEENKPKFMFGAAVADAVVIPLDATCAQAVAMLDVPSP